MSSKLRNYLEKLYPKVVDKIIDEIKTVECSYEEKSDKDWYKTFNLYIAYPDTFIDANGKSNLYSFIERLDYIKELGFNAVHILPFLKSPLIDFGFDIDDFYNVRDFLGGNDAVNKLKVEADKRGLKLFMDITFNHISFNHDWYKNAVKGDEHYRNFFVHQKEKPNLVEKYNDKYGHWAKYKFGEKEVDARIIFPEQAREIPHWTQAEDGYWYFHTFYPHQLDLDWHNPDVFIEMAKVLRFWADKGFNFRLDAILFAGKDVKNGIFETSEATHDIIQALHEIIKGCNPESVFLTEAFQPIETLMTYFGKSDDIESELAYNFHFNVNLWSAVITQNKTVLEKTIDDTFINPEFSQWITFVRNHDELSIEYTEPEIKDLLYSKLLNKGLDFRKGYVAGRTFSFLDEDISRHVMIYFLLASLPGNPALIYGDELGKENDFEYMKSRTSSKIDRIEDHGIKDDTRDINRGQIDSEQVNSDRGKLIYGAFSKIFNTRLKHKYLYKQKPEFIGKDKQVIGMRYRSNKGQILDIYINLSDQEKEIYVEDNGESVINIGNYELIENTKKLKLDPFSGVWLSINNEK